MAQINVNGKSMDVVADGATRSFGFCGKSLA